MQSPLEQAFYARDALEVAPDLIGKLLCRGDVVLRISEVEAYCHPDDSASHCRMGRTPRNEPMWGPAGHAYIYLCYGMHHMLNIVTNREGEGAAVLIRACELVSGHELVRERREGITGPNALTGPGKVGAALGLTLQSSGSSLCDARDVYLLDAPRPAQILSGPRVGIGYASPTHQRAAWRFALADSAWVSHRKTLVPMRAAAQAKRGARAGTASLTARSG
ncbi:MAG TPA: DNA-3-methyladenine glycosylase [Polyangiales bacterium]|nr:DNA-3-methyladenine glycosylase [Polyangiales bacterium]